MDATERLQSVRDLLQRFVTVEDVPGAALAVALDGETVFEHYVGDAAPGQPASPATLWPIASISKVYTATVLTALVERGELPFSQPAQMVLPNSPATGGSTSRSGICSRIQRG